MPHRAFAWIAATPGRIALVVLLGVGLVGCGGGGGGTGDPTTPAGPTTPTPSPTPTARILFPPAVSLTTLDSITVRGTTTEASAVVAVRVNGLLAATSDGFGTWRRTVPLTLGENAIRVDVETTDGDVLADAAEASVGRSAALVSAPTSLGWDPGGGVAYVHDAHEGLLRFAPATSVWTVASPEDFAVSGPTGGAFDASTNTYYQLYRDTLRRIDVSTGARTSVTGNGPALSSRMEDVDVDGAGSAYIVGDFFSSVDEAVVRVDLATGDRFELSSASVGTGTAFADPTAVDAVGGAIYVFDNGPETLIQVDPSTGNRTVLIDTTSTFTVSSLDAVGLVVEPANTRAYVAVKGVVHALDWTAGTVTTVFDRANGHEDELGDFRGIAGAPGMRLLAIDAPSRQSGGWAGLSSIELGTAALTVLTDASVGSGPRASLTSLEDVVVDTVRGDLLLVDDDGFLLTLDLATGLRTVVSSDTVGSGPEVGSSPDALVFDGDRTAFVGTGGSVFAVDVVTGARRLVSEDGAMGSGPEFDTYGGLSWDPEQERLVAGAQTDDLLMRIDPPTGNRVLFTTEVLYDLYDLDLDAARDRVYMATEYDPGPTYRILTADLATGVVTTLIDFDADTSDDLGSVELLASDAATGRLFVFDHPLIAEIDATTGVPTVVADLNDPTAGPLGTYAEGMAAAPLTGVLYLTSDYGVHALDAATGERVLIAK